MKEDGGHAFAQPVEINGRGMSLRDYFAAAALTGYRCAYHQWYQRVGAEDKLADPGQLAKWAYADADAMLVERSK